MNYIKRLEAENAMLRERLAMGSEEIRLFRIHLDLPKFKGIDYDGARKDWIAVTDVQNALSNIKDAYNGLA